ncbi:hypothetical protein [Spirosoma sp. KUDC1026]|uniref:hypothetical protein n=1 Tax=Spirosoma sp. KUDC1026 TaxID=2745947 RepID=UPI00159BDF3E|nr:hypothetical protein [Spirosoma sp. KUDC1026]QKZ11546.1 hypothetical protein HU175_02425 [Spirosoma sp. KUDC1026]
MKKLLLFGLSVVLATGCSSGDEKTKAVVSEPVYTLVFLDKTRSVDVNQAFVAGKYKQALSDIIDQNIRRKGDKLEIYYIHENTSKARALSFTARTEMEDVSSASPTDREAAQTEFELMLKREKATIRQRALQQLAEENEGASNQSTDIWASLPVITKASETGATVKVYYLSDMLESVKAKPGSEELRRDFEVQPPQSNAQADDWAMADKEQLKRYAIGNPDITMILPFAPNASAKQNNPAVTQYWETLFTELGAASIEER